MTVNYSQLSEQEYNLELIDKLESRDKISKTRAKLFKLFTVLGKNPILNWKLTSKGSQMGLITIAHKVEGSQYSILRQKAKTVLGNQMLVNLFGGKQTAEIVGGSQIQFGVISNFFNQKAKKVGGNQFQFGFVLNLGNQEAEIVELHQDQGGGINLGNQKVKNVFGSQDQRGVFINTGNQEAKNVFKDQEQGGFINTGNQESFRVLEDQHQEGILLNTGNQKAIIIKGDQSKIGAVNIGSQNSGTVQKTQSKKGIINIGDQSAMKVDERQVTGGIVHIGDQENKGSDSTNQKMSGILLNIGDQWGLGAKNEENREKLQEKIGALTIGDQLTTPAKQVIKTIINLGNQRGANNQKVLPLFGFIKKALLHIGLQEKLNSKSYNIVKAFLNKGKTINYDTQADETDVL